MESLASTTLYLAIAACALAHAAYWAHTIGRGLVVLQPATPNGAGLTAAALEDHAWDRYVSIEMRSGSNGAGNVFRVRRAVETAQGAYHE